MKQFIIFIFLSIFTFSSQVFALYDFAAINITPDGEHISFCFEYDTQIVDLDKSYFAENFYIATVTQLAEILFVEPTQAGGIILSQWLSGNNVPVFSQWRDSLKPICLNPFTKSDLQSLQIYAGIGNSLEDVIQRNRIFKFFDGFPDLPKPEKAWTVMVYMIGSDLEGKPGYHWASKDILEMLEGSALSNQTSNTVITTGGSTRNGWTTVKRSLIENGQQYVLEDLGEKNMAAPETLSDFVSWAKTNFPAQHYALILWDHGGGTQGYGKDTSPVGSGEMMSIKQLHQAYQTIRQTVEIEKPLDIVVYDASLMASIEVAEVTATVANAMASSAELVPGHGIDYAQLLSNIDASPPANGIFFGRVVKIAYIQPAKNKGTFDTSQVTYSVFDLTQLPSFSETFKQFAIDFKNLLENSSFLTYEAISRGIISVPSYPLIETGLLLTDSQHIRIDLYNILQTVGPGFTFSQSATDLLKSLDQMVVDYEANDRVKKIHSEAGRVSIDINITNTEHLSVLPEAYTLFNEGLVYYDQRRQADGFTPDGGIVCFGGITCGCGSWLVLDADNILGIEAYFGQDQPSGDGFDIYRIDNSFYFYQYRELTEDLYHLGVDGHKACQYQICVNGVNDVNDSDCENITLTEQDNQLVADVLLNDSPTLLSFCQAADDQWFACGVVAHKDGIWGRDEVVLYPGDSVIPRTLHMKNDDIEERDGLALVVEESARVTLKSHCDPEKGAILVAFYSVNKEREFESLCNCGDCLCHEDDVDPGCQKMGFKAGVILKP